MSYRFDNAEMRDLANDYASSYNQESRDAQRFTVGGCYQHHHRPDGRGGGTCRCGDTISAGELHDT